MMRTIEVDPQVFAALEARASGFGRTPNHVLRALLELDQAAPARAPTRAAPDPVSELIDSREYALLRKAEDRYLSVLSLLHSLHRESFPKLQEYGRGIRPYFAKSQKEITDAADYAGAKQIPRTPFFAMTTLDNKNKAKVLAYALELCGHPQTTIKKVIGSFPTQSRKNPPSQR